MSTHGSPALRLNPGGFLAAELLRNERVACSDPDAVAATIATQVDAVPYYVHLTVQALMERGTVVEEADIEPLVDERLSDPLDRWQLLHYVDRLKDYYGDEAPVVKALLDAVAVSARPLRFVELSSLLAHAVVPPPPDRVGELLDLLGKDHYLAFARNGSVSFRLELLRRAWMARRRLEP